MNSKKNKGIIFMGLAVAINLVGGFIALSLKLPIYIDTIGTILVSIWTSKWSCGWRIIINY